jgi:hypothetical protein
MIGDLLISGGPGELYPQIPLTVKDIVKPKAQLVIGLSGDMLGYILAPFPESYPEPVRRSFFDNDTSCGPFGCPSPIDNDNYFFNVSHTLGERVICSMLRGAGDVTGNGLDYWSEYSKCPAFASDLFFPAGADTQFPGEE